MNVYKTPAVASDSDDAAIAEAIRDSAGIHFVSTRARGRVLVRLFIAPPYVWQCCWFLGALAPAIPPAAQRHPVFRTIHSYDVQAAGTCTLGFDFFTGWAFSSYMGGGAVGVEEG